MTMVEEIKKPSKEIMEILERKPPKKAYQAIAIKYGGKAAGLMLSAFLLRKEIENGEVKMPFGIALSQNELEARACDAYHRIREEKLEKIIARSSAAGEDSFIDRMAGVGISQSIDISTESKWMDDIRIYHAECKERIHTMDVHVVLRSEERRVGKES